MSIPVLDLEEKATGGLCTCVNIKADRADTFSWSHNVTPHYD